MNTMAQNIHFASLSVRINRGSLEMTILKSKIRVRWLIYRGWSRSGGTDACNYPLNKSGDAGPLRALSGDRTCL